MPSRRSIAELRALVSGYNEDALRNILKAERISAGWTQEDVAERIAMSRGNISKYETGQSTPSIVDAALLCAAYGISLDDLARRIGIPVARTGIVDVQGAQLADAIRLLTGSADAAWRDRVVERLYAEVVAHEAGEDLAEGAEPDDPGRFHAGIIPPKPGR